MSKLARTYLAAAVGTAALAGSTTIAEAQELRLSTFVAPVHVIYREILTPWSQEVAKATNGEVKVTLYPSMQLGGKPPELFRQAKEGVVDLVFTLPGYTSPAFPGPDDRAARAPARRHRGHRQRVCSTPTSRRCEGTQ
jgi:TRAP-type C4-dicarboxylate transport system substrate-binding protein